MYRLTESHIIQYQHIIVISKYQRIQIMYVFSIITLNISHLTQVIWFKPPFAIVTYFRRAFSLVTNGRRRRMWVPYSLRST